MRTVRPHRCALPRRSPPARDWALATLVVALLLVGGGWALDRSSAADPRRARSTVLPYGLAALRPLQQPLPDPEPGDWLAEHREDGETFDAWRAAAPVRATGERRVLYIQPIGTFAAASRRIVTDTADYMARYFSLEVRLLPDLPPERIPKHVRRVHPAWGDPQILSTYVLERVLAPRLPADAAALIAFTSSDLWPGGGWNFVFGQASLRKRVGVWSIYRNGDPTEGGMAYRRCLRRTCQTATHETGHMFSMKHCIAYACNMNGSNHRAEADRQPMACCPECAAKVCSATGAEPRGRLRALGAFCRTRGMDSDAGVFERFLHALEARPEPR